jgi:hypothetical protein
MPLGRSIWSGFVAGGKGLTDERYTNLTYKTWLALMAKEEAEGEHSLSEAEQIFRCVYLLDLEVHNGGYDQYFFNSSSDYANQLVSSLRHIGANRTAELSASAVQVMFPSNIVPIDRSERFDQIEIAEKLDPDVRGKLHLLDKQFYEEAEDVFPLLESLARKHGFLVSKGETG